MSVLMLMGVALVITAALLDSTSNNTKIISVKKLHNNRYYDVEEHLGRVTAWLQDNSKYFVTLFTAANFTTNFTASSTPSLGANEATYFGVPTRVKLVGTSNSALITNNSNFGTSAFPNTTHIDTSASFNPITAFQSAFPDADNGGVNLRILLLSVADAGGDFSPIFRVDAITGNNPDRGTHVYSNVYGTFTNPGGDDSGFFGQNSVAITSNSWCKSKVFTSGASTWTAGGERNNCQIQSNSTITLSGMGTKVYGSAQTLVPGAISDETKVTDNNSAGCDDASCHTTTLVTTGNYSNTIVAFASNAACSSPLTLTVSSDQTLTSSPGADCWDSITIDNNRTLTLTTTDHPYYINNLNYLGTKAELAIDPGAPADDKFVEVHFETVTSGHLNGKRIINPDDAPHQFKLFFTGNSGIELNGTADMRAHFYAPFSTVTVNGNFELYGKINALAISSTGTADLFSDEVNTATTLATSDVNFTVRKMSRRLR